MRRQHCRRGDDVIETYSTRLIATLRTAPFPGISDIFVAKTKNSIERVYTRSHTDEWGVFYPGFSAFTTYLTWGSPRLLLVSKRCAGPRPCVDPAWLYQFVAPLQALEYDGERLVNVYIAWRR